MIYQTVSYHGWNDTTKLQILSFWTTLCYANDLYPDTNAYDSLLLEIYDKINRLIPTSERTGENLAAHMPELTTFDAFDNFMCQYIV